MSHAQNIQRTLEAMFNQKTNAAGVFRLNQGMQFSRPAGPYLFMAVVIDIAVAVTLMINVSVLIGVLILLMCIPLVAYIIDIQGVEVDFKNGKIRKYQSFLGLRSGEWLDLAAFDSIRVYQHQLKTRKERLTSRAKKYDTHAYYYVRLVSPGLTKSISLLELSDYGRAKMQAEKVARSARLILIEKPARLKEDKA